MDRDRDVLRLSQGALVMAHLKPGVEQGGRAGSEELGGHRAAAPQ